jgi:uncharacterized protein (TIGR03435 family)
MGMQLITIVILAAAAVSAQTQDSRPTYEAANVTLNTSGGGDSSSHGSGSQVIMTNQTLKRLVERAYSVQANQVVGPEWLTSVYVDVAAKYPPKTKNEDRSVMLRTLLEDRFKMKVHRETRELPGYALVVGKGGLKVKPSAAGTSGMDSEGGAVVTLKAVKQTMSGLAEFVSRYMGAKVVDKTGLDGVYDFEMRFTRDDQNPNAVQTAPSLATALQETLGLRLQAQKVPVELIVVDHMERAPVEN